MTVLTTNTINTYTGNGVTTVFPFTFPILDTADVVVTLISAAGVETVQALTTNYTIPGSDVGLAAGNVTMLVAPATGVTVQLERIVAVTQPTDFLNQGRFYPETHERAFDRLLMLIQRAIGLGMNALRVAPREGPIAALPATDPAGKFVGFDLDGNPALLDGTDEFLRADLVSSASGKGAALVSFIQPYTGAAPLTLQTVLRYTININDFLGCDPGGVSLSDTAFASAAATGKTIELTPGATYYLSQRVTMQNGSKFVCNGRCTIKLKTGTGGFNNTDLSVKNTQAVFWFSAVDDNAIEGVDFTTDGVKEVTIYPIRSVGGFTSKGIDIRRVRVIGLSGLNGGYISLNSVGAGAYRIKDYEVINCGTAQGTAYWTGGMQITGWEIDNDIIPGVYSEPGYAENIRCTNLLLTGQALTDYGQQTDLINIAGSNASERKGPTVAGIYANGVGEVIDTFGSFGVFTGIRAANVHNFVGKFIHGAQHNSMQIDSVESCGIAVCVFAGSSSAGRPTRYNVCRIATAKAVGDAGTGPSEANAAVVAIYENGGTAGNLGLPKNNYAEIDMCVGTANFDNVVYDNCTVDNANANRVEVHQASGYVGKFCAVNQAANTRVRYKAAQACEMTQTGTQALASATDVTIPFTTVVRDVDGIYGVVANNIRPKFPGEYIIHAQIRIQTPAAATDYVIVSVLKNGSAFRQFNIPYATTLVEAIPQILCSVYVSETEIGSTSADWSIRARHVAAGAGSVNSTATPAYCFFTMTPTG